MRRISTGLRGLAVGVLVVAAACSSGRSQESVGSTSQAVTSPTAARVLSFEQPTTDWSATNLNLQQGNQFVDGQHSAAVTVVSSGGKLTSIPLSSLGPISSTVTLQVRLPAYVASTSWQGQVALWLNSPSAGVWSQYFGPFQFSNTQTGVFRQAQFALPSATVAALSNSTYTDLTAAVEVDFNPNPNPKAGFSDPFYIDKLDFGQGSLSGGGGAGGASGASGSGGATGAGGAGTGGAGTGGAGGIAGGGASGAGTGGGAGATGTTGAAGTGTTGPCSFSAEPAGGSSDVAFTIKLPRGVRREDIAVGTTGGYLTLDDGVSIVKDSGGFASVSSVQAASRTNLGVGVNVQDLYTETTGIDLRTNAHVHGTLQTAADFTTQTGVAIDGGSLQNTSLQALESISWSVSFPTTNHGSCSIEPDNTEVIDPGSYGDIAVKSRSHLKVRSGTYYFNSLSFEPQSELDIDNSAGPVFLYVRTSFAFSGSVIETNRSHMNILFGVAGNGNIAIQTAFRGILVAPFAGVSLPTDSTLGHVGAFFANSLIAHQNTAIHQRPFAPSEFCASDAACSSFCPCGDDGGVCGGTPVNHDPSVADPNCVDGACCPAGANMVTLTNGADTSTNSAANACVLALAGNDTLFSAVPGVTVVGGDGDDTIAAGQFSPPGTAEAPVRVFGGPGNDTISGWFDGAQIYGGPGDDTISAGPGPVLVAPGSGADTVSSGDGDDTFILYSECEATPGKKLFANGGFDTLISPLSIDQLRARGITVEGFESVIIRSDACKADCTQKPNCGAGSQCADRGGQAVCGGSSGASCQTCNDCASGLSCSGGTCQDSTVCDPVAKSDCRPGCPCETGSQCVSDQDCQGELICALGMGPAFGRPRGTNACVKRFCTTSPSQGCGYPGAPCGSCDDAVPCTQDGDCPGSEVCAKGAGSSVNASTPNVCLPAECQTAQAECGDPSSKCGKCACTPNCATKKCGDDPSDGCGGHCTVFCGDRQPSCQTDADCPDGDACIQGGGPRLGLPASVNVCLPRICLNPNPKVASCGTVADVCGVCPAVPVDACENRTCGLDPTYGTQCGPTDVPCIQGNVVRAFSRFDLDLSSSGRGSTPPVKVPALTVTEPVDANNVEPGALAGSFEVDPRGNATYTIPIVVPPGRAGMRPAISLDYNSRSGNGIAGVGWSVGGLSTIARCPKTVATDGFLAPVQYDDTDALCLDGARLLVVSGEPFQTGTEYRTEIDTFQKVLVVGSTDESGISFRVLQKNGQIREYGGSGQEKLYREATPNMRTPRAWALSRIQDRAGNKVTLTYGKLENTESRMSSDVSQDTLEFFPDEIAYGGIDNEFGSSESRIEVKFDYSDDRSDYMEGFTSSGARITRTKRLKAIRTLIADQPIRSYELAYKYAATGLGESFDPGSTGPSRLDTVQECSSKNGVRACTPATALGYADERGFAPNTAVAAAPSLHGPLFTMDANGDGFADLVVVGDGTSPATILVSNGSRATVEFTSFIIEPPAGEQPCFSQASVVDTDGDGRDDLVDLCPHMRSSPSRPEAEHIYRIYKFSGTGQPTDVVAVTVEGLSYDKPRAFIVDADGDGVADLFECNDPDGTSTRGEVHFFAGHRGAGPAFDKNPSGVISSDAMVGNCQLFGFPKPNQRPVPVKASPITVQDITGDGVPDLLIHQTIPELAGESLVGASRWFRYVLGSGAGAHWESVWFDNTSMDVWNDPSRFKFVDVNGDGLKDLITLESTPQLAINSGGHMLPQGSPFAPDTDPKLIARFTKYSLMNSVGLDYDGDGAEDLLRLLEPASGDPAAADAHWLWDRANTDSARYGTFKLDQAPLSLTLLNSFFLNVQPNIEPPKGSGGRYPGFALADVDGDGSVDLVQLRDGGGVGVTFGHFGHENLLTSVVDGLGKRVEVKYDAQSSFSDRTVAPTYRMAPPPPFANQVDPDPPCVVDGNTSCVKHVGPVVSSFRVLQSAKGSLSNTPDVGYHFRYEGARVGLLGRGWLGFGKTTIEKVWGTFPETPIDVTEVKRDNQTFLTSGNLFPFAGRETSRMTTTQLAQSAIESHPARRRETTTQQWEVGQSADNIPFPFVRLHVQQTDEELDTGDVLPITTVTRHVTTINGYGDVELSDTTTQAGGADLATQTLTEGFDLRRVLPNDPNVPDSWLVDLPKRRSVTESVFGTASAKPREEHVVSWTYDADGLLQTITREPDADEDSGLKLVTTLERYQDVNRNIRTVTTQGSWKDGAQVTQGTRSISFQYDADGISPRRVIRHQGDDCAVNPALDDATDSGFGSTCLIQDIKFDPRDGTLIGRIDAAGVGTQMSYDAFGRVLSQVRPDDEVHYNYAEGTPFVIGSNYIVGTRLQVTVQDVTIGGTSTKGIDALGRVVQVASPGLDGDQVFQEFSYDWGGVLGNVTRAHLAGDASQGEVDYSYDERWRLKERDFPDQTSIGYLHSASANAIADTVTEGQELWISGVVDQRGHTSLQHQDFRGNSLRSVDEKRNFTRYVYDAFGTLGAITDAQGNVTTISTDKLGRVTSHQDADTGEQDRQYTAFNELFTFTDGVGTDTPRKRVYQYDDVGRLLTLTAPEGPTSFAYDQGVNAAGRLVETSSPDGHAEHYDYEDPPANGDPMLNRAFLKTITRQIGGSSFATGLTYDDKNELSRVDQPASSDGSHFAVRYEYDGVGHLKRVKGTSPDKKNDDALFWQRDSNFQGQAIATEEFGNGVTTGYTYDDKTGRLTDLTTKDPGDTILQELKYIDYDNNGNVKTRSSSFLDVGSDTLEVFDESYDYDELDRLTTINVGKSTTTVGYDSIGNIKSKDAVGTYNYAEDGKTARPHAVQNISTSNGKVVDLKYDDFGNTIHRSGDGVEGESQDVTYSSFNLPTLVTLGTGSQVHYQYDASQNRVLVDVGDCTDPTSSTCNRRVYVGDDYERQSATDGSGAFIRDLYKVFAAGRQVAQIEREARPGSSTETRRYLHADHLGSSQLLTDETGKVAGLRRFDAFGQTLGTPSTDAASSSVRAGFTGHETDVETGLVNMRGRIYDPRLGRFLQADPPLSESPFWSQGLNRYSYAFNNPLRFTDPSGFDGEDDPPPDPPPDDPPPDVPPDDPPPDDGGEASQPADCGTSDECAAAATQAMIDRFTRYDEELNKSGASTDPAKGDSEAMHEDSSSASNGTPGTAGGIISDEARRDTYFTLGAGQGAVPFGTLGSDISPPKTARDRFDLGTGQLAGAATTLGESGTIAAAGGAEALTGVGIPFAIATEVAAVVVAVGAATNAIEGIYNIATGDGDGGGGTPQALKPEAKYLRGGKHGVDWKEGPALAKTDGPQGQWGSKADLDYAGQKAATLKPGESGKFPLPEGHSSVVHLEDGTTVPANNFWVRNNGTGTFHGYPTL